MFVVSFLGVAKIENQVLSFVGILIDVEVLPKRPKT